jgi:hypothetical protein
MLGQAAHDPLLVSLGSKLELGSLELSPCASGGWVICNESVYADVDQVRDEVETGSGSREGNTYKSAEGFSDGSERKKEDEPVGSPGLDGESELVSHVDHRLGGEGDEAREVHVGNVGCVRGGHRREEVGVDGSGGLGGSFGNGGAVEGVDVDTKLIQKGKVGMRRVS